MLQGLGYAGFESAALEDWRQFGTGLRDVGNRTVANFAGAPVDLAAIWRDADARPWTPIADPTVSAR